MHTQQIDAWSEGFRAGYSGKKYSANPYEGTRHGAAWAFGCDQGMKDRNSLALRTVLDMLAEA